MSRSDPRGPAGAEHREAWERLYTGLRRLLRGRADRGDARQGLGLAARSRRTRSRAWWRWADRGRPVGLAHFRPFARPLAASIGGFLDDLFVAPEARGSGAAQALIEAVAARGRERGWTVIRWITAEDNYRGRSVYDRVAQKTKWLTYEIKLV